MTSLGEIRFGRKDIQAMNVLMCRKLVAALYQVRRWASQQASLIASRITLGCA